MVIIFDNSVFPLKHYVKRFLNAFWGTKSYLWVAKLEESMTNLCPKLSFEANLTSVITKRFCRMFVFQRAKKENAP